MRDSGGQVAGFVGVAEGKIEMLFTEMSPHRLVVAPRSGLRRAPNKHHRIYESEYLARRTLTGAESADSFDYGDTRISKSSIIQRFR